MLKVDNEVKKQLDNLEMNPLLREIIANSNSIDIAKDVKNPQKDTAGAVAAAVEAAGNKLWVLLDQNVAWAQKDRLLHN